MITRGAKIFLVASTGLMLLIVGLDNILDYGTNFDGVRHTLSMDAISPPSPLAWRAITSPILHHLFYWLIIAAELAGAGVALYGAWRLAQVLRLDARSFNGAKETAVLGLAIGLALYFTGFMVVGGEWFEMWRAGDWNMQQPAFRFVGSVGVVLIFLVQPDAEL